MILTNLKFVVSFKFCSNPWASELFGSQLVWHRITRLNLLVNGLTQELLFSGARIPIVVQMLNGSNLEWHSKTEQPDHSKFNQIAAFMDFYILVPFWMVGIIATAVAMVPIILIPNHYQFEHQNVQISNGFWILLFGIWAPTVLP